MSRFDEFDPEEVAAMQTLVVRELEAILDSDSISSKTSLAFILTDLKNEINDYIVEFIGELGRE